MKVTQLCPTLCDPMDYTGQNTGIGSLSLLQGIFPTQGQNSHVAGWSHKGSPRILEWVPIPSPVDLPDPGIKLGFPALQADSLPLPSTTWEDQIVSQPKYNSLIRN